MAVRVISLSSPGAWPSWKLSFLVTTVVVFVELVAGQQGSPLSARETACGTKFTDPSSSAILADVVLQGSVQDLHQASPLTPLLYRAKITIRKVYKGQDLLTTGLLSTAETDNNADNNTSRSNNGSNNITTTTTAAPSKSRPVRFIEVERFGPDENKESCVAQVQEGNTYLFFLKVKDASAGSPATAATRTAGGGRQRSTASSSSSFERREENVSAGSSRHRRDDDHADDDAPLLVNTALPVEMDMKGLRQVKKVLCPGCPSVPVIRRLKCKSCALAPKMKKKMSAGDVKKVKVGKKLALRCVARGSPRPSYIWVKDSTIVHSPEDKGEADAGDGQSEARGPAARRGGTTSRVFRSGSMIIRNNRKHSLLIIKKAKPDDQGIYHCLATNAVGEAEQSVQVVVEGGRPSRPASRPRNDLDRDLGRGSRPSPDLDLRAGGGSQTSSSSSSRGSSSSSGSSACASDPCYNGGTCYPDERVSRIARCECPTAYHGNRCQFRRRRQLVEEEEEEEEIEDDHPASDEENLPSPAADTPPQQNNNVEENMPSSSSNNDNRLQTSSTSQTGNASTTNVGATDDQSPASLATPAADVSSQSSDAPAPPASTERPYLTKKKRRKYANLSRRKSYGPGKSKSVAPQLAVSECPEADYCLNGGTCKIVVRIQRRFCDCPLGFAGRKCEINVKPGL